MSELRITPEQVLAAYHQTGRKPINGCDVRGDCLCPIQVLYLVEPFPNNMAGLWSEYKYGLAYRYGFVDGVDGDVDEKSGPHWLPGYGSRYEQGYADGRAVWAAVERELLKT